MKKMAAKLWDLPGVVHLPALAVISALFLCGAVVGCVVATYVPGGITGALADYLAGYLISVKSGLTAATSLKDAFFNSFKYHTISFLLGFTALGVVLIPLLAVARGFFLSFAVSAFVKILGYKGLLLAAGVVGIQCLFTLPCLFLISSQAFSSSSALLSFALKRDRKSYESLYGRSYFIRAAFAAVILSLCALFESYILPLIVSAIASYI